MRNKLLAAAAALTLCFSAGIPAALSSYASEGDYGQIYDIDDDYYDSGQGGILDSDYEYEGYGNTEEDSAVLYSEDNVISGSESPTVTYNENNVISGNESGYGQYQTAQPNPVKTFIICLGIGLLIGLIVTMSMRASMKSVHRATGAADYKNPNGINMRERRDDFMYNRIEKTPIQRQQTPPTAPTQGNRPNQTPRP